MPYIYGSTQFYYNLHTNIIEEKRRSIDYYQHEQMNSVLKHLGIIK